MSKRVESCEHRISGSQESLGDVGHGVDSRGATARAKRLLVWRFLDAGNNEGLGTLSMSAPT